jgi:hypothetical protein
MFGIASSSGLEDTKTSRDTEGTDGSLRNKLKSCIPSTGCSPLLFSIDVFAAWTEEDGRILVDLVANCHSYADRGLIISVCAIADN